MTESGIWVHGESLGRNVEESVATLDNATPQRERRFVGESEVSLGQRFVKPRRLLAETGRRYRPWAQTRLRCSQCVPGASMLCQVPRGLLETIKVPAETSGGLLMEPND